MIKIRKAFYGMAILMILIIVSSCTSQVSQEKKPEAGESSEEPQQKGEAETAKADLKGLNVNSVWAYEASTGQVLFKIPVGEKPAHLDTAGDYIFVANEGSDSVSVIDVMKKGVVKTIKVGKSPHGLRVSKDGKMAVVANKGESTISLIDAENLEEVTKITVGKSPVQVAISPESKYAFVTKEEGNELVKVNLIIKQVVGAGLGAHVGIAKLPGTPRDVDINDKDVLFAVSQGTNEVSVISAIDMNALTKFPVTVGDKPKGVAVDTISKMAFVTNTESDSVSAISTESFEVLKTASAGDKPQGIAVNPYQGDKGVLYTANGGSNDISVVDISSMQKVKTWSAGINPHSIAVSEDGRMVFVSMMGTGQ